MWGVRRRDAARHNESGWLIRPEDALPPLSPLLLWYFLFIFVFCPYPYPPPAISRRTGSCMPEGNMGSLSPC